MPEELGKIERPAVEEVRAGRKLYFVPLILSPEDPEADLRERVSKYWGQVEAHLASLEDKLGEVSQVYHELIAVGGEEGAKTIEEFNSLGYRIVRARLDRGAELQPIEDGDLLAEFLDWSKCLMVGLQSQKAFTRVYDSYIEAQKARNQHLARCIDQTLKPERAGILLMREGHQLQFPPDIQVFYVAPPGLDELKRWLHEREGQN